MATTDLPRDTDADIARVTEALGMITPRWNVRILLALSGRPQRYSEIADTMSWLPNSQLHLKLRALCDAGLVERTAHNSRHVTYGHTGRAKALLPVLPLIVTWAEEHLEQPDRPLPAIEQIEDSLTLLTRRHAAAILWALKSRQEASGRALARIVLPGRGLSGVYPPLRQLVADGLVCTDGPGHPYRLSHAGNALGTVFGTLSAWAAGQALTQAAAHPVWGHQDAAPAPTRWVSNPARIPAPAPVKAGHSTPATWAHGGLFSHAAPAGPKPALAAGGPRR